ncbi:unnamed protein product [Mycena citricolor]|uniref:Uncharacterized protein n=1 Tax=Mycena citricolor TaxID=2018698 RepID=A0AAD2K683_9AGAR|nr:unnamed protein product [Mycena citricolor]
MLRSQPRKCCGHVVSRNCQANSSLQPYKQRLVRITWNSGRCHYGHGRVCKCFLTPPKKPSHLSPFMLRLVTA